MLFVLLLLFLVNNGIVAAAMKPHVCEYDSADHMLQAKRAEYNRLRSFDDVDLANAVSGLGKRQTAAPMRFKFDTTFLKAGSNYCSFVGKSVPPLSGPCSEDDILTPERETALVQLLLELENWIQVAFDVVRPVSGRLRLSAGSCGVNGGVTVPNNMVSPGVTGTDTIAFVTAWPTGSTAAAYAAGCRFDSVARPTAGHINIAPATIADALVTGTPAALDFVYKIMMHEIFHVLGFNSGDWAWYVNPSTGQSLGLSAVIDFSPSGFFNKDVHVIKLPGARTAARDHFNCGTLAGVELEDRDTSTRASNEPSSHLEKRVYNQELMNPVVWPTGIRVSEVSLAVLGSSGWYTANLSQAESLDWGHDAGCSFATGTCGGWTDQYKLCELPTDRGCTFDRLGRGYCGLNNYGAGVVPSYAHPYLVDNTIGGDERLDYCPIVFPWSNGLCADVQPGSENWPWGESYGDPSSRCVESTLLQNGATPASRDGRCFQHRCGPDNELQLLVQQLWVECPKGGGPISVPGYTGQLHCPVSTQFCCEPRCAAGRCSHGQCMCDPGFQGVACTSCRADAGPSCSAQTAPAAAPAAPGTPQMLIADGAANIWSHHHRPNAVSQGLLWTSTGYSEPGWATGGSAPFGSANGPFTAATSVNSATDTFHYYRAQFTVSDKSKVSWVRIRLAVAGAADVYVNGEAVDLDATAGSTRVASYWTRTVAASADILVTGANLLAVLTRNQAGAVAFFDVELTVMCPLCQPPTPAPTPYPTPQPTPLAPPPVCSIDQDQPKAHGSATRTLWAVGGPVGVDQAWITEVERILAVNYAPADVAAPNTSPGAAFMLLDSTGRVELDTAGGFVELDADAALGMGSTVLGPAFADTLDVVMLQGDNTVMQQAVSSGAFSAARTAALSLFHRARCSRAYPYFVVPFAARSASTYDTDQQTVHRGYKDAAEFVRAATADAFIGAVPVGRAFELVRDQDQASFLNPYLSGSTFYSLYEAGGQRASETGRYLAALVTQVALTGFPPTERSAATPPASLATGGRATQFRTHATNAVFTNLWSSLTGWQYAWARRWNQPNTTDHFMAWGQDRWLVDGGCCARAQLMVDPTANTQVDAVDLQNYAAASLSPSAVASFTVQTLTLGPRSSARVTSGLVRVAHLAADATSVYSLAQVTAGTLMLGGADTGGQIKHSNAGTMIWSATATGSGTGQFVLRPTVHSVVWVQQRDFLVDDPTTVIRVELNALSVPAFAADRSGSAAWGVIGVTTGRCELLRGRLQLRQTTRGSTSTTWFTVVSASAGLAIGSGFTVEATDDVVSCRQVLAGTAMIPSLQCRFGPPPTAGETAPAATAAPDPLPATGIRFNMLLPGSLAAASRLIVSGFAVRVSCPGGGIINLGRGQFGCFDSEANEDPATAALLAVGQQLLVQFLDGRTARLRSLELSNFVDGVDLGQLQLNPSSRRRAQLATVPVNTSFWEAVPGGGSEASLSGQPVISSFSLTSQSGVFSLDAFTVAPEAGPDSTYASGNGAGTGTGADAGASCTSLAPTICLLPFNVDCCVYANTCYGGERDAGGFCVNPPASGGPGSTPVAGGTTTQGGLQQAGFCFNRDGLWCSDDLGSEIRCAGGVVQAIRDCGTGCRQVLDSPNQSQCGSPGAFMDPEAGGPGGGGGTPGGNSGTGTGTGNEFDDLFAGFPNPGEALGLKASEFYGLVGLIFLVLCILCVCASIISRRRAAAREREARNRAARHDWATDLDGNRRRQIVLNEMALGGHDSSSGGRDVYIVTVDIPELRAQKKMKFEADMLTSDVRKYIVNSVIKRGLWPSSTNPADYQLYLNYTNSGAALLSNLSLRDNAVKTNHRIILKKKPRDDDDDWVPDLRPPSERHGHVSPRKRSPRSAHVDPEKEALKLKKAKMERDLEAKRLELAEIKRQARQAERERAAKDFVQNLGGIELSDDDDEADGSSSNNMTSSGRKKKVVRRRSRTPSRSIHGPRASQHTMDLSPAAASSSSSDDDAGSVAVIEMVQTEAPVAREIEAIANEDDDDDDDGSDDDSLPVVQL